MDNFRDKWCLISGASSGIGAEFARQLASRGAKLVLVARRQDRLDQLATELASQHGTESQVVCLDLTEPNAISQLQTSTVEVPVELLINNAGFGHYGDFHEMDRKRAVKMMQLNTQAVVELAHAFLPNMLERKSGAIINVASTSAFQAIPYMSLYSATKAFVLHFSEGLWAETRKKGVTIQALCPGFTKTEFFDSASLPQSVAFGTTTVQQVVSDSLNKLGKGKQYTVPGWINYVLAMSNRLVTRRLGAVRGAKMFHPKRHQKS